MLYQGSDRPSAVFISDFQRVHCLAEGKVFSEWLGAPLTNAIKAAGIKQEEHGFLCLHGSNNLVSRQPENLSPASRQADLDLFRSWRNAHSTCTLVPLGEYALELVTGLRGISKWQCSVVPAKAEYGGQKCLPMFHPDYVSRVWADHVYLRIGCRKLSFELKFPEIRIPERKFLLSPPLNETLEYLNDVVAKAPEIAIDWEFGRGQLNTLGFAVSATEAIAIKCLPQDYSPANYFRLFDAVRNVLEGPNKKIIQHSIVEVSWMARYGIRIENVSHDTMWAQRLLHPELDKGLDNVGRIYTPYPYWKDDNDDWSNIRNWQQHLEYNCKDTTGTFAGYQGQQTALKQRGLWALFYDFVMKFQPVIQEMVTTGLLRDQNAVEHLRERFMREQDNFQHIIAMVSRETMGKAINPRSPKQLQELLKALGMKLPTKTVRGKLQAQETTDKKALIKLKRKHHDSEILPALIGLSATNKRLSSYIDFDYDRETNKVHCTLDGCSTETFRWASYNSSWDTGFNAQTVPKAVRVCFVAEPGTKLVQIDLKQAESRYVAWEAPEPRLMDLLEGGADIHRYVAAKIFNKHEAMVQDLERQLGKKAGHAANYGTGPRTFAEACLVEMNHYIEEKEARAILEGYFQTFPGIRTRQQNIKQVIYNKRFIRTPLGFERHFFGRANDATFREAYAFSPQCTIPAITNHLMLSLWRDRDHLGLAWDEGGRFLLQVHDSLLLQVADGREHDVAAYARDLKVWHPEIVLPGGKLMIPVDVEFGSSWGKMVKL